MRYYRIDVDGETLYTSHPSGPSGPPDRGALNVEMDLITTNGSTPSGSSYCRIWGIGLDAIAQAQNYNNKSIAIYGGMGVGLPLATLQSQEAGLLIKGQIYPAFGNWEGINQTLDFIIVAGGDASPAGAGGPNKPANLVHQLKPQQKLADAIQQALSTAFPNYKAVIAISDSLTVNYEDRGFYQGFDQYAKYLKQFSVAVMNSGKALLDGNYMGVEMAFTGDTISVYDGTKQATNQKTINFYDFLGQPTWIGTNVVSVKTVMRGDINVGDQVTLPPTATTTTAAAAVVPRNSSVFQGTFQVRGVRHVGNFRQPDGLSWNSTFEVIVPGSNGT